MARWILPEKRAAIYIRDRFTCCYCGSDLRHANRKEIGLDHLISRHHGGSNAATNLSTCCGLCNSSKGARDYNEYATGGSLARIERTRVLPVNVDLGRALIEGYGPEWECWGSDSDGDGSGNARIGWRVLACTCLTHTNGDGTRGPRYPAWPASMGIRCTAWNRISTLSRATVGAIVVLVAAIMPT